MNSTNTATSYPAAIIHHPTGNFAKIAASFYRNARLISDKYFKHLKLIQMKRFLFAGLCALSLTAAMAAGAEKKSKTKKPAATKEQCCDKKSSHCCQQGCCH